MPRPKKFLLTRHNLGVGCGTKWLKVVAMGVTVERGDWEWDD